MVRFIVQSVYKNFLPLRYVFSNRNTVFRDLKLFERMSDVVEDVFGDSSALGIVETVRNPTLGGLDDASGSWSPKTVSGKQRAAGEELKWCCQRVA